MRQESCNLQSTGSLSLNLKGFGMFKDELIEELGSYMKSLGKC